MLPLIAPAGAFSTIRSNSTGPRIPLAPKCTCAIVAALFIPANVPLTDSRVPVSVAITTPDPVMLAAVELSTGTGVRRAR